MGGFPPADTFYWVVFNTFNRVNERVLYVKPFNNNEMNMWQYLCK